MGDAKLEPRRADGAGGKVLLLKYCEYGEVFSIDRLASLWRSGGHGSVKNDVEN